MPEGYKIKGDVSNSIPNATMPSRSANGGISSPRASLRPRELAPFCGILKVGGYDCQQPMYPPDVDDLPPLEYDPMDGEDSLPASSKESIATIPPTGRVPASVRPSNPHKRSFRDEDEVEENNSTDLVIYEDEEAPSANQGWCRQGSSSILDPNVSRPLAQPKTRRKGLARPSKRHAVHDQENTDSSMSCGTPDFEEADFLQPSEVFCNDVGMDE